MFDCVTLYPALFLSDQIARCSYNMILFPERHLVLSRNIIIVGEIAAGLNTFLQNFNFNGLKIFKKAS